MAVCKAGAAEKEVWLNVPCYYYVIKWIVSICVFLGFRVIFLTEYCHVMCQCLYVLMYLSLSCANVFNLYSVYLSSYIVINYTMTLFWPVNIASVLVAMINMFFNFIYS